MPGEQEQPHQGLNGFNDRVKAANTENVSYLSPSEVGLVNEDDIVSDGELANNDGSVVETLDTVFHDKPGFIKDHSMSGSNRADYYEARSDGESDSEEELDLLRKQQAEPGS